MNRLTRAAAWALLACGACAANQYGSTGLSRARRWSGGLDPGEERTVCHLDYRAGEWRGRTLELPLWLVYEHHIGMHPTDYWGECRPEDIRPLVVEPKPGTGTEDEGPKMGSRRGGKKKEER